MPHHLIRKLERFVPLATEDKEVLLGLEQKTRQIERDADILPESSSAKHINLILSGWACRYKHLNDGGRQITSLLLPGDLYDPHTFLDQMAHPVAALTPVTLAKIPDRAVQELAARSPALAEAFRCEALATAAIQREWTVSLGRRSGMERLAHLFCEMHARLTAVGLADGPSCPMPLTQSDLADALGQTAVHINRTLKELRGMGLITLCKRRLTIHDPDVLADLAHFDPVYLHFTRGMLPTDVGAGSASESASDRQRGEVARPNMVRPNPKGSPRMTYSDGMTNRLAALEADIIRLCQLSAWARS